MLKNQSQPLSFDKYCWIMSFFHTKWDLVEMHKRVCRNYVSLPPSFPVSFSFSFVWLIYMWTGEVLHWVGVGEGAAYRRPLTAHCRGGESSCAKKRIRIVHVPLYKVQITFSKIAKLVWLCGAASQPTINVCMVKWAVWSATGMASRPMNRPTLLFRLLN